MKHLVLLWLMIRIVKIKIVQSLQPNYWTNFERASQQPKIYG